jgi:ribosomal protein S18 acetylase RimI-like enzyme
VLGDVEMMLRLLGPDDWETWRDLRLAALATSPEAFGSKLADEQEYDEAAWRDMMTSGVRVVAEAPEPAGLVGGTPHDGRPDILVLWSVWVRPSHQGQGIGEALVREVLTWAAEQGVRRVKLHVFDHNDRARRLYQRLGFVEVPGHPAHMQYFVRP